MTGRSRHVLRLLRQILRQNNADAKAKAVNPSLVYRLRRSGAGARSGAACADGSASAPNAFPVACEGG